jgi:iron complex outermembrane recepter protein
MSKRSALVRQAVIASLAFAAAPTFAQQTAQNEEESSRTIESIIVTAQKREQSLQDVPIVVTAVSEQLLQDTGVRDIKDLTVLTPGLTVTSTSSEASTTARIRGVGTVGDNPGLESSVGVVIDGVYRPRNGVGFGDLGELERIEVLKGPQGTLFGKNTSAGVINIISKRPSQDFSSQVEVTAGNYGALEGSASINGGLREGVSARLYVGARERDGFLDVRRGAGPRQELEDNDRDVETARAQLLLEPSEALNIRFVGDYSQRNESCCGGVQVVRGPAAAAVDALAGGRGVNLPDDAFEREVYLNRSDTQEIEDLGGSVEVNYDAGAATITSISAYRTWESINAQDVDFTAADIWHRDPDGYHAADFTQLSQEFRIAGETDRLSWLAGAFYANEDLENRQQLQYGSQYRTYMLALTGGPASPLVPLTIGATPGAQAALAQAYTPGIGQRDLHEQDSRSWAVFTNNNFRVTDALELTLGARYTNEAKDLDTRYSNTHGGVGCQSIRSNFAALQAGMVGAGLPAATRDAINRVAVGIGCAAFTDPIYNNLNNAQDIDEDEVSGTAKVAYRFTDQVMTYVSYARGYKASGFNLDRVRTGSAALNPGTPGGVGASLDTSFDKELVDSYELGVKSQWAGDSLLLNASVFYQDYQDFQLNTFDGVQFLVTSLEQVVSQGVDLDIVWFTPLEQLSLQGGVTYADTQIEDPVALANPGLFAQNREDDTLSFAPEWSASLSATFEQPLGTDLTWRTNVGAKYTSEYNTGSNLVPQKMQDAMTIVTARTGIGAENESWMIEAWAQNLTDEEYYQVVFDAPLQTGSFNAFLGAPRTYGLTARFKF